MRHIQSSGSVKITSLDAEALKRDLKRIASKTIENHGEVKAIYLFGSIAREDHTGLSDADVLIVLTESNQDPLQRIRSFLPYFDLPIGVDLVVHTEEELRSMEEQDNPFVKRLIEERLQLI